MEWNEILETKLSKKEISISIFGMGYVGLPLAVKFSNSNYINKVYGIEINEDKIKKLNEKSSYIDDVSHAELALAIDNGLIITSNSFDSVLNSEVSIICVPTPVDNSGFPDLKYIYSSVDNIVLGLKNKLNLKGIPHIIILESTTYPTTTEISIRNILEKSGLKLNHDFTLCFSPERIDPGNSNYDVKSIPKVVGGINLETSRIVEKLYHDSLGIEIIVASSPKTAEMTKLFENIFRQVNIALVNELAIICETMGIDVFETINLASTKPFGFLAHYPGPGLGGHCIPVDPYYLSYIAKQYKVQTRFIDLASEVNFGMLAHTIKLSLKALNNVKKSIKGSKIGIIGYTYKPNISDIRNSPAIPISNELTKLGGKILICDKYLNDIKIPYDVVDLTHLIVNCDLIIIITPHDYIDWNYLISNLTPSQPLLDTRGVYSMSEYRDIDEKLGRG